MKLYEIERIIKQINKKNRFYFNELNRKIYIFDCLSFNVYVLPNCFSINEEKLLYYIDNGNEYENSILLSDIISTSFRIPKYQANNEPLPLYKFDFNKISEKNYKDDSVLAKYFCRIVNKELIHLHNCNLCEKCIWKYICDFDSSSEFCIIQKDKGFEKLINKLFSVLKDNDPDTIINYFKHK
jgi:hypothetical protein